MKLSVTIAALLCCFFATAQKPVITPIGSAVYQWDPSKASSDKSSTLQTMFSGSGAIMAAHNMYGITVHKGKILVFPGNPHLEHFFVVKKGPVTVTLNGKKSSIDRGSCVFVLAGDKVQFENETSGDISLYDMSYESPTPDAARGKAAGESFVMNWNDMVAKPTDKGSTRQLFTRATTMFNRFDIHVTQLNQGFNSHPPHTHKNEEIILMLDGNAEMQIGETPHIKANGGDVVYLESNIPHNLTNVGTVPCLYFAIQWN